MIQPAEQNHNAVAHTLDTANSQVGNILDISMLEQFRYNIKKKRKRFEIIRIRDQNFLDFFPQKSVSMAELTQARAIGKLPEHYPNYSTRGQTQS